MKEPRTPTTDAKESVEANPHPESSHRAPRQIAADARGPTAPRPAQHRSVHEVDPEQRIDAESASDVERRRAVKRSAHTGTAGATRNDAASARDTGARTPDQRNAPRKPEPGAP